MQQKIQCPNCGATSDFIDKRAGTFLCAYCGSTFEHVSVVPNIAINNQLYNQVEEIYKELLKLTPDRPKYHERILTGLLQISGFTQAMTDVAIEKKTFNLWEKLLEREVAVYSNYNIDYSEIGINMTANDIEGNLIKAIYLKQVFALWAYHLSKVAVNDKDLDSALKKVLQGQEIKLTVDLPIVDLRRVRFGLLRRLGKNEEAFTYLDELLENTEDSDQVHYDFEDAFKSSDYLEYKKDFNL